MFRHFRKQEKIAKPQVDEKIHRLKTEQKNREEFESIMSFSLRVMEKAKELEKNHGPHSQDLEHPIIDVVRLLGRKIQTHYLTNLLYVENESDLPNLHPDEVLFNSRTMLSLDGKRFGELINQTVDDKTISLNKDLVLPWSWKTFRLVTCIARIGKGRAGGQWRQDNNHHVELWLPLGIAWVYSGNHSISVGIIQGEGSLKPAAIYDISDVYDYVYCDGSHYYRKEDGAVISPVYNVEFAAIFEIGRIMKENSISY